MALRKWLGLCLALLSLPVLAQQGNIGSIGQDPGATVLIPHFEVDPDDVGGRNTIVTLQNTSATAMLVNTTLWTDYGVPTAHFLIYLTGYDQETINLYDVFQRYTPRTASVGQDPTDTISPKGDISQDINFASCTGLLPDAQTGLVDTSLVQAHTGGPSLEYFGGLCGGRNYGDGIARGYITMDTVNNCTPRVPGDPGYIESDVTFQNVLAADYTLIDPASGRRSTQTAVHVEADPSNSLVNGAGDRTFYARLTGNSGADRREALPTAFAGRTLGGQTSVEYWRDPGSVVAPFTCGNTPAPYPLPQRAVAVYNDNGGNFAAPTGNLFPYATGTTTGSALSLTQPFGWMFANLNPAAGTIRQSWLSFVRTASDGSTYYMPPIQLGNATTGDDPAAP